MINALSFNCQILALDTNFNQEMLISKKAIFFKKNTESIINSLELFIRKYDHIKRKNRDYNLPSIYNWDNITSSYIELFQNP